MKKLALKLTLGLTIMSSLGVSSNYGLVIGCCSKYKTASHINPLFGTTNDASSFKKFLIESGNVPSNHIDYLTGARATKKAITDSLKRAVNNKNLKRGDRLYIYYSGHGSSPYDTGYFGKKINSDKALKDFLNNSTALVPYDVNTKHLVETLIITKRDFKPLFKKLDQRGVKVVWITDACYAGNAYRSTKPTSIKHAPLSYHHSKRDNNNINYNHLLFYGASLSTLPTQEHRHNGEMRGDFSFELENCLKRPTKSGYIHHNELKKCLNQNFANTQIQHNYYPLSSKLDKEVVMRVPKKMQRVERLTSYKERLFKLANNQPLLKTSVRSLDSNSQVIKSFCNREQLSVTLLSNHAKYLLAFTKDEQGKVVMIQPDSKQPMQGEEFFKMQVEQPYGSETNQVKVFTTDSESIYKTALKFANKPQGVLSADDIKQIYNAIKKSNDFQTANLTIETISRDVNECRKGD